MSNFINASRNELYIFPKTIDEYLPATHMARFIVDMVEQLDLSAITNSYRGAGSAAYPPDKMLALLLYGYVTGVFSSRKLEEATYDSMAFRYITADTHPDHDTIATFRKRLDSQIEKYFTKILMIAGASGVLRLGSVCLDGTKIKANASKHKALSYAHARKLEEICQKEVEELLKKAADAEYSNVADGLDIPEELKRREERLARIRNAIETIEERAEERDTEKKKEYEAKIAQRAEREKEQGRKPRGKSPQPPTTGPKPKDQVNLTDEESRIMPVSGGGFEQAYNAQAGVDTETMLVVYKDVTQHTNDAQEVKPALQGLQALPEKLGRVTQLIADAGYCSEENIAACRDRTKEPETNNGSTIEEKKTEHPWSIEPFMAVSREKHGQSRIKKEVETEQPGKKASEIEKMAYKLKTEAGRKVYAVRKHVVEPVFGIIKNVLGYRSFMR